MRAALAMHVEHEAADRHRRIAAIVDQFVPVGVALLGDVLPERGQQILRMARRQRALGQRSAQRDGFAARRRSRRAGSPPAVEQRELFALAERRVIGDVVGRPHEFVEGEDGGAMLARGSASEATGKFSSRWPLPDRKSDAVIGLPTLRLRASLPHAAAPARMPHGGIERVQQIEQGDRRETASPRAATRDRTAGSAATRPPSAIHAAIPEPRRSMGE